MDSVVACVVINKMKVPNKDELDTEQTEQNIFSLGSLISLAIFVFAAYVSWSCNSNCFPSMQGIEKSIRALFAGLFGVIYLLIYIIAWSAGCDSCVNNTNN